jgi:hypothetical protein
LFCSLGCFIFSLSLSLSLLFSLSLSSFFLTILTDSSVNNKVKRISKNLFFKLNVLGYCLVPSMFHPSVRSGWKWPEWSAVGKVSSYALVLSSTAALHPLYEETTPLPTGKCSSSFHANMQGLPLWPKGNSHHQISPSQSGITRSLSHEQNDTQVKSSSFSPFSMAVPWASQCICD